MIEKYNSKYIECSENELVICIGEDFSALPIFGVKLPIGMKRAKKYYVGASLLEKQTQKTKKNTLQLKN